jgi:hypothetical protein
MCSQGCKHWEVSQEIVNGNVNQVCKDCGKIVIMPGIMSNVMDWMRERPEYRSKLHYIETVYSRTL